MSSDTNQRLSNIESALSKAYATHAEETRLLKDVLTSLILSLEVMKILSPAEDGIAYTLKQKVTSLDQIERRWWLLSKTIRS